MHRSLLIENIIVASGKPLEIVAHFAIQFRRNKSSRSTVDQRGRPRYFDRKQQGFRHRLSQEMIDIADVLAEEPVELRIIFGGMIVAEPPEPIASFGNQNFFIS